MDQTFNHKSPKILHHMKKSALSLTLLSLLSGLLTTFAATDTWDGGAATISWNTDANWVDNGKPTSGDSVLLDNSAVTLPSALALDAAFAVQSITLNSGASNILQSNSSGTSTRILTLNGDGGVSPLITVTGSSNLTLQSSSGTTGTLSLVLGNSGRFQVDAGSSLDIQSVVSGATSALEKTGSGTLTLRGTNTFGGGFTLTSGVVQVAAARALGAAASTTTLAGGTITTAGAISTQSQALSITGDVTFGATGGGILTFSGATGTKSTTGNRILTFNTNTTVFSTGALDLGGNLTIQGATGANFSGGIRTGAANRQLTFSQSTTTTIGLLTLGGNLLVDGSGAGNATLSGGLDTGGVDRTLTFNKTGGAASLSGALTGTASKITIGGTGDVGIGALTGATAHSVEVNGAGLYNFTGANTYTGATSVLAGTARAGLAATFANTSLLTVASGARLEAGVSNVDLSKMTSGLAAGAFLRYSAVQTAANPTGPGTILGTVELNSNSSPGVGLTYALTLGSGGKIVQLATDNSQPIIQFNSPVVLAGNASLENAGLPGQTKLLNKGAISGSGAGLKVITFSGEIEHSNSGAAGAIISDGTGGGTLGIRVNGGLLQVVSSANTYTGGTTVDAGELRLNGASSSLGSTSGALTVNGGFFNMTGRGITVGALNGNGGQIVGNSGSSRTLTVGTGDANGSYSGVITDENDNVSVGLLGLTKTGAGTQTLSGANSYSGLTQVSVGTLLVNGDQSLATGAVTVASGATLGGTGTIGGNTTISAGGRLSPGNSPGTISFSGNLNVSGASFVDFEAGDLINAEGALSLSNSWTLVLGTGFADGGTTTLFEYGSIGTLATGWNDIARIDATGLGFSPTSLSFTDTGTSIILNGISVIPEPTTVVMMLGGLGLAALIRRRRA